MPSIFVWLKYYWIRNNNFDCNLSLLSWVWNEKYMRNAWLLWIPTTAQAVITADDDSKDNKKDMNEGSGPLNIHENNTNRHETIHLIFKWFTTNLIRYCSVSFRIFIEFWFGSMAQASALQSVAIHAVGWQWRKGTAIFTSHPLPLHC